MAIIKKSNNIKYWRGCILCEVSYISSGSVKWYNHFWNILADSNKVKHIHSLFLSNSTYTFSKEKWKLCPTKCTRKFRTALFIVANKCSCSIFIEYYSEIKTKNPCNDMDESQKQLLCKRRQMLKYTYYKIIFIWNPRIDKNDL